MEISCTVHFTVFTRFFFTRKKNDFSKYQQVEISDIYKKFVRHILTKSTTQKSVQKKKLNLINIMKK